MPLRYTSLETLPELQKAIAGARFQLPQLQFRESLLAQTCKPDLMCFWRTGKHTVYSRLSHLHLIFRNATLVLKTVSDTN